MNGLMTPNQAIERHNRLYDTELKPIESMGIDPNTLPDHVQDQIKKKKAQGRRGTAAAIQGMKAKAPARKVRMNKTERNYAGHLEMLKKAGEIKDWKHEPFNLRLADNCYYRPDFAVLTNNNHIEIHEVKGRWRDDALVKIKVASEHFPWFTFRAVFNESGHWKFRDFKTQKTGITS